jgi:hypothetical protein
VSTQEVLRQRAERISAGLAAPVWEEWVEEGKREIERLKKQAATLALSPEGADQRKLDYLRGYIAAVRWSYKMPEAAGHKHDRWIEEMEAEEHV